MSATAIVLQARMGSTRLPGKVLATLGGWSILEHCVRRLALSGQPVIVATTALSQDDAIEAEARRLGVEVFRGEVDDVLGRYLAAARAFGLSMLVRATADNPLVDTGGVERSLAFRQRVGADHVVERGLPVGTAVEVVTVEALERAASLITDPYDREHVTSFIRRDSRFTALRVVAPGTLRRPGLRLTVDTPEDLELVQRIYAELGAAGRIPALTDVIAAADAHIVRAVAQKRIKQGA